MTEDRLNTVLSMRSMLLFNFHQGGGKMRTLSYVGLAVLLAGCAVQAATIPAPPEVKITPPAAGLAPELAAFSGTWEGSWDDSNVPARLVVESIDAQSARVVYAWADHPQGSFKGGWTRRSAKVLPDGRIQWGSEPRLTFTMGKDRMRIEGEWEKGGIISMVIMKKVGQ